MADTLTRPRTKYTDQEIEQGMVALALNSGNAGRASRALADQGVHIPERTLYDWVHNWPDRYAQVRESVLPRVKAELAEAHTALGMQQLEVSRLMTERLKREYEEIPARDLPSGVRNISTASAIHADKARDARGEPAVIHEHRSMRDMLEAMQRDFGGAIKVTNLEGTATELKSPPAPES